MNLFDAELLLEMKALPVVALGGMVAVGLGLWLTGWWGHRFWITVLTTAVAGLVGLKIGPDYGVEQPLIAGVLLALAGGCLALALVRLVLFGVYGLAAWQLMQQFAPPYAIPLVCITAGGLISIFFFRLCVILLTTAAGTLLLSYGGLALAGQHGIPLETLVRDYALVLNLGAGLVWLVGVVIQQRLARAQRRAEVRRREEDRLVRRHAPAITLEKAA